MKQPDLPMTVSGHTQDKSADNSSAREAYYRHLAEENGRRSLREIDRLSRLFDEFRATEAALTSQLKQRELFSTLSAKLLQLPFTHIREAIGESLGQIGEFYGIDRIVVLAIDEQEHVMCRISGWDAPGVAPHDPAFSSIPLEQCAWFLQAENTHDVINIPALDAIEDHNAREHLKKTDLVSMVIAPMVTVEHLIGVVGIEMVHEHQPWKDDELIGFSMLADIFANALTREINGRQRRMLEEQLQIRQRMDSLGTLASGIAHDFNNLLVAIMGNLDLLLHRDEGLNESQKNYITEAFQATKRAARLTGEIQSLSRDTVPHQSVVDIHTIVDEVFRILERTTDRLIEKNNRFRADEYYVVGNADQLHQVFLNLGTNAIHAITEKGVEPGDQIAVSARRYIADTNDKRNLVPGTYVHIIFSDTGTGMTEDVRKRAFDPLFTTRQSTGMGQGLGLAMVYTIITKKHAGYIDIQSSPGRGTRVHMYLPLAKRPVCSSVTDAPSDFSGAETVLVVEDEEAVREAVAQTLGYFGYTVIRAVDGEEGLFKFSTQPDAIDLVLLDLTMPKLPGWEVLERMRAIRPDIPVIITSGHSEQEFENHPPTAGFIQKPYEIARLGALIRDVLTRVGVG